VRLEPACCCNPRLHVCVYVCVCVCVCVFVCLCVFVCIYTHTHICCCNPRLHPALTPVQTCVEYGGLSPASEMLYPCMSGQASRVNRRLCCVAAAAAPLYLLLLLPCITCSAGIWATSFAADGQPRDSLCLHASTKVGARGSFRARAQIALHRLHFRRVSCSPPSHPTAHAPLLRTDAIVALLHVAITFVDAGSSQPLGSSSACPFTLPLIHIPPSLHPEFIAYDVPPAAAAAAAAAAAHHMLDCAHDISAGTHAPSSFICTVQHHPSSLLHPSSSLLQPEHLRIPAPALAAAAARATGVTLEAPADAALFLLGLGDFGGFDTLASLQLNVWLVNGQYSAAVQQLLLLVAATHYLVAAAAVHHNALVNCSAAPAPLPAHLPSPCIHLLYIHRRFVAPAPTRYSPSLLPFGRTNYSADIDGAGGHLFATLLQRQQPWQQLLPALAADAGPSEVMQEWGQRVGQWRDSSAVRQQQHLRYGSDDAAAAAAAGGSGGEASVKSSDLDLDVLPLEENLVLDRRPPPHSHTPPPFPPHTIIPSSSPPPPPPLQML